MKKITFLVIATVAFLFTSCDKKAENKVLSLEEAQQQSQELASSGKYPVMTFDTRDHDFGTIARGTKVEHLFEFTNTGDAPLILSDARGTCGCTVPELTREPIMPGERGSVLVSFDGSGSGQRNNSVTINANTQRGSETIMVRAFVESNQ